MSFLSISYIFDKYSPLKNSKKFQKYTNLKDFVLKQRYCQKEYFIIKSFPSDDYKCFLKLIDLYGIYIDLNKSFYEQDKLILNKLEKNSKLKTKSSRRRRRIATYLFRFMKCKEIENNLQSNLYSEFFVEGKNTIPSIELYNYLEDYLNYDSISIVEDYVNIQFINQKSLRIIKYYSSVLISCPGIFLLSSLCNHSNNNYYNVINVKIINRIIKDFFQNFDYKLHNLVHDLLNLIDKKKFKTVELILSVGYFVEQIYFKLPIKSIYHLYKCSLFLLKWYSQALVFFETHNEFTSVSVDHKKYNINHSSGNINLYNNLQQILENLRNQNRICGSILCKYLNLNTKLNTNLPITLMENYELKEYREKLQKSENINNNQLILNLTY